MAAQEPVEIAITTHLLVNVNRYPSGVVSANAHKTLEHAMMETKAVENGARGGRTVARVRVPLICVEGQFDV
jgi:hypothetical protein